MRKVNIWDIRDALRDINRNFYFTDVDFTLVGYSKLNRENAEELLRRIQSDEFDRICANDAYVLNESTIKTLINLGLLIQTKGSNEDDCI